MEINEKQLGELLDTAVEKSMANHFKTFYVDPERHYKDHLLIRGCVESQDEMRLNHEFVSTVRGYSDTGKKKSFLVLITAAVGFTLWMMKEAITHWVTGG